MKRLPFVVICKPGLKAAGIAALHSIWSDIKTVLTAQGAANVSIWGIGDFLFCYGEYPENFTLPSSCKASWEKVLSPYLELFAAPGTLSLTYHDIGIVRKDKSLIRKSPNRIGIFNVLFSRIDKIKPAIPHFRTIRKIRFNHK